MKSSNSINSDTFAAAVAELAAQVEGPDGHWQAAEIIIAVAEAIVARIDGTVSTDRTNALIHAAKLKHLWDGTTDRDAARKFDSIVAELASVGSSKSPEYFHDLATSLVERADGTEFADMLCVWRLEQAAKLKALWTPRPDLGNAVDPSELEQDFVDVFTEAASGRVWLRAMVSTPDQFLNAVEVSAGHDRAVLESLTIMSEAERRAWLESCIEREGENCRREGRTFLDSDAMSLSGSHDYHGDLHTCMLPMAARVLLAYRHAPAVQHLALAA